MTKLEELDATYSSAIRQLLHANLTLFSACADILIYQQGSDPEALLACISHGTTKLSEHDKGGFYEAITLAAMRSLAEAKYSDPAKAPEWVRKAITGEQPVERLVVAPAAPKPQELN